MRQLNRILIRLDANVSIQGVDNKHLCGGTLLRSKWVLTAGHCCEEKEERFVFTGLSTLKRNVVQKSAVVACFVHPNFSKTYLTNDVGLMQLRTSIYESETIKYIKLASRESWDRRREIDCKRALVLGFGYQGDVLLNGTAVDDEEVFDGQLKCIYLSMVRFSECNDKYGFHPSIFCAMYLIERKPGRCSGDSGGPFMCNDVQYGIISSAVGCGMGVYPSLYARVDLHEEFFNFTIRNDVSTRTFPLFILCLFIILELKLNGICLFIAWIQ